MQPDGTESVEKTRKVVQIALEEGMNHFEWALHRFDGQEVLVDCSFTPVRLAGKPILFTVLRDITERKRSEDAIRQAEEKYRNIFENVTEGIFQTAPEGSVMSANPAFSNLFGYSSPEEMLDSVKNVTYEIYVDPERRSELKQFLDKQGFVKDFEVQCRKKNGEIIWISTNMRVVCNDEGKIMFYEGTMTDITERKNIQGDLENKSRSLEDANAALRALLKHREQNNYELEEKVVNNIKELVMPYLDRLKTNKSQTNQAVVDIIESNLGEIMSPFLRRMASKYENFTPKEIRIADLIKKGKTTKEMSTLLGLSTRTIDIHRYNIRRKLNLNNKKINLQSYLLSLTG
jgi:PAS domain S-box-containing protein